MGQSGPLILDHRLQPVWFQPVPETVVASNLSLQSYEGKPALAWWQGRVTNTGAIETGEDVVVNQHYQVVARLKATDGWVITLHEFTISGEDAWVTANKNIAMDLSKYGGAYNGALVDSAVQEYNLRTGRLLRTWDALDHIPLSESQASLPTNGFPWDAYHVNSIDLQSRRHVPGLDAQHLGRLPGEHQDRRDRWTLGGRNSSFTFGPGAAFQWQHDVRLQPGSQVSLFDDHCCQLTGGGTYVPRDRRPRAALVLKLDEQAHTATLAAQVTLGGRSRRRLHGQRPAAAEREHLHRLGLGTVLLGVRQLRQAPLRRRTARPGPHLQGDAGAVGRASARPRPPAPPGGRAAPPPSTRAGTARRASRPGGSWRGRPAER